MGGEGRRPSAAGARGGRFGRSLAGLIALPLLAAGLAVSQPAAQTAGASGLPGSLPGAVPTPLDLTRPRILGAGADLAAVTARLVREPYRSIFLRLVSNGNGAAGQDLADHSIEAERIKAKATKDLAFEYAINRTRRAGEPAPFATEADRQAAGDQARTLLLNMYTRSRLAVPSPLGGTDRDINTSEELLQYSTAYDTLVAAGYPFGADDATIRTRITDLAAELYADYLDPTLVSSATAVLPNNHRSKSAAALGVAALALLETAPAPGAPPADVRSPVGWLTFALDQIDIVQRYTYVAPDGGYGEGVYYQRYAAQNLLPFARAWSHANHAEAWDVGGRSIPDLWTSPWYRQTQRWVLDMTMPNGALAPIDDGNVDFSYYFGAAPTTPADAAAFAWRWANAPTPYDTDGSVDLSADTLAAYEDSTVPSPPSGSPTRFYREGGDAVFRSDWGPTATTAVVLGEHGPAMELGRDRTGLGQVASAAHEQPDTGSFFLDSFGEKLLLDPGYMTYGQRGLVGKAPDHNLVLVDGAGPADPFFPSIFWVNDPAGLPPALDGQATITDTRDTTFLDTARVTSAYANTEVQRRFFFVDDRYVISADTLQAAAGGTPTYSWPLHGNGGGTSGGTFTPLPAGGEWTHGAARLDAAVATDAGPVSMSTRDSNHEGAGRVLLTHTTATASSTATGPTTHGLVVAYPSRSGDSAPTIETLPSSPAGASIRITDTAGDRIVVATHRADGNVTIRDTHLDGTVRVRYSDAATELRGANNVKVTSSGRGPLGVRVSGPAAALLAPANVTVRIQRLPFSVGQADGACGLVRSGSGATVVVGPDGAVTLRARRGNSAPSASAGADRDGATVGSVTRLRGGGCDLDHDQLHPHWELVAAPAGSAWSLTNVNSWRPRLTIDAPGPFRARLTVTDVRGATSRPSEVELYGGSRCTGDRLTWNDPRCG